VAHFFELWRNFDGRRLPVRHSRKWLDVTALHNGNQLHIALTNMGGQRIEANLTGIAAGSLKSISQTWLYYRDGEVHFEDSNELSALDSVEVDVEAEEDADAVRQLKNGAVQLSRIDSNHKGRPVNFALSRHGPRMRVSLQYGSKLIGRGQDPQLFLTKRDDRPNSG